jgi:hypothetical protein
MHPRQTLLQGQGDKGEAADIRMRKLCKIGGTNPRVSSKLTKKISVQIEQTETRSVSIVFRFDL